jgi:hypothetical protein
MKIINEFICHLLKWRHKNPSNAGIRQYAVLGAYDVQLFEECLSFDSHVARGVFLLSLLALPHVNFLSIFP